MTNKRQRERAAKVTARILEEPELAFLICGLLNNAKLAGPWESHPSLNVVGRLAPTPPGKNLGFAATVHHADKDGMFGWVAGTINSPFKDIVGEPLSVEKGSSPTLAEAVHEADQKLRENGWTLTSRSRVGTAWSPVPRNEDTGDAVRGTIWRIVAGSVGPSSLAEITFDQHGMDEGCTIECFALPSTKIGVIERRMGEDPFETYKRAANLIDGLLRQDGWLLEPGGLE